MYYYGFEKSDFFPFSRNDKEAYGLHPAPSPPSRLSLLEKKIETI